MGKLAAMGVALVVAASGAGVAGCGGGDDGSAEPTTTSEAAPTVDAADHVLRLEDFASDDPLDAPWEEGDVSAGVPIELPACIDEAGAAADGTVTAKFVTVTDLHLPAVDQQVTAHRSAADAAAAYDEAVARLDGCGTPTFVYEGEPSTGSTTVLELPAMAERSRAWRTTVTIAGAQVSITTVHAVEGVLHMSLVHTEVGAPDQARIEAIVAKAAARLA